jgi:hypothetical protein
MSNPNHKQDDNPTVMRVRDGNTTINNKWIITVFMGILALCTEKGIELTAPLRGEKQKTQYQSRADSDNSTIIRELDNINKHLDRIDERQDRFAELLGERNSKP